MAEYEYLVKHFTGWHGAILEMLNELGADGWKVVASSGTHGIILMREK
jgi:hypothetical protein